MSTRISLGHRSFPAFVGCTQQPVYPGPGRAEEGIAAVLENSAFDPSLKECEPEKEQTWPNYECGLHPGATRFRRASCCTG